jgi:hypothetical protein
MYGQTVEKMKKKKTSNLLHRVTIFFILFDYPPGNPIIAKTSLLHGSNRHYSQHYKWEIPQWLSKHSVTIFTTRHTYFIIYNMEIYNMEMHFLVLAFIFLHHAKPRDKVRSHLSTLCLEFIIRLLNVIQKVAAWMSVSDLQFMRGTGTERQ